MKTLLTVAGFDPSSGAGVTADLAVFAAHDCFGISCVTALTVQSTQGVRATYPVDSHIVTETLETLSLDLPPTAVKIGMLATGENVRAVTAFVAGRRQFGPLSVVLDPVLRSSSGAPLLSSEAAVTLKYVLLPHVDWVTPNLDELAILVGRPVRAPAEMESGALELQNAFPGLGIVVTGGHLGSTDDLVIAPRGVVTWLAGKRIESRSTHGTGCAFSSAMACGLIRGLSGVEAARAAKNFVREAIHQAPQVGSGTGPMNLLWPLRRAFEAS